MHPEKGPAVEHTAGPEECGLFVAGEVGDAVKALLQVGIGGDAVGHLAVVEQWVRANEKHPETYVSRCCFLVGAGGLREPRRKGARVAAPSGCIVPWAARASCWPQPQQLLPVSAAGSGRRCCTGAFFPAGLFGGSMLFESTRLASGKVITKQKLQYPVRILEFLVERSNPNPNHCPLGHSWRQFHRKRWFLCRLCS